MHILVENSAVAARVFACPPVASRVAFTRQRLFVLAMIAGPLGAGFGFGLALDPERVAGACGLLPVLVRLTVAPAAGLFATGSARIAIGRISRSPSLA